MFPGVAAPQSVDYAIKLLFDKYDKNKDGKLSTDELIPLFEQTLEDLGKDRKMNPVEVKEFIEMFDVNHDGEIDYEEMRLIFKKVINKSSNQVQAINPILKELNLV
jgi:Ca2+-binding EF-hand superfamily protein